MSELKPCPFCGGEAWMRISDAPQILRIECRECHAATTSFVADSIGEKEAAAAWNTRTDYHGYEQAAIEAWKSIKKWNTRHVETCKVVGSYYSELMDVYVFSFSCRDSIWWNDEEPPKFCPECGRMVER